MCSSPRSSSAVEAVEIANEAKALKAQRLRRFPRLPRRPLRGVWLVGAVARLPAGSTPRHAPTPTGPRLANRLRLHGISPARDTTHLLGQPKRLRQGPLLRHPQLEQQAPARQSTTSAERNSTRARQTLTRFRSAASARARACLPPMRRPPASHRDRPRPLTDSSRLVTAPSAMTMKSAGASAASSETLRLSPRSAPVFRPSAASTAPISAPSPH